MWKHSGHWHRRNPCGVQGYSWTPHEGGYFYPRALQLESELPARGPRIGPQEPCERRECERVSERVRLVRSYSGKLPSVLKIG
jgi:hypothetical protein